MLWFFVPSDEEEVSEDPRPVPRKSKKMVKLFNISWSYILIYDPWNVLALAQLILGQVTEYPPAKTGG